ncbi:hypothetical protein EXIGLDRAFT_28705 [Exidia glandulosa HHB12029]|uniref:Tetraspannin-domain-containing protein n=1 Tax=Exidia glandulosa HHB12029 TaxID=1314781 RepID=A0A165P9R7_EXIGL|nr:hypothetical protein EXIGLDRAFT_28705 [Exidia glandulosa HHB12029]
MSRTFCCCLPVRLGVFILSFLQLLSGGASAALIWYAFVKLQPDELHGSARIAFIVAGAIFSLLVLAACLGLIGAMTRSRPLVAFYSTVLYILIALETAAAVYFLVILFRDGGDSIAELCHKEAQKLVDGIPVPDNVNVNVPDVNIQQACTDLVKGSKWAYIVTFVIDLLIQLYCAYIVSSYVGQLSDEQAFRAVDNNWKGTAPPQSYYPHQPLQQQSQSFAVYGVMIHCILRSSLDPWTLSPLFRNVLCRPMPLLQ